MITPEQHNIMLKWASNKKIPINDIFKIGDSLKNSKKNKKLAILAPSYLLHKINYQKLIESDNIDTMTVNKGHFMPGTEKCDFYLPFTTHGKTMEYNRNEDYIKWLTNFKGLVMHGIHIPDPPSPYILATVPELQYIINACPKTKIIAWRHAWGTYLTTGHMTTKMCEFPYFTDWTPSKIPWAHCGAISGFAIPLAMALGYSKIYVIGMGYEFVSNDFNTGHLKPLINHNAIKSGSWLHAAPVRFSNQANLAKTHGIELAVGPKELVEPKLLNFFDSFEEIEDLI